VATQLTLGEVLERAIRKEVEAQRLYVGLSSTVYDTAVKDAFQNLSQQEKGH